MTARVIGSILKRDANLCCLCFDSVDGDFLSLHDDALIDLKTNSAVEIAEILIYVLGKNIVNLAADDVICNSCFKSARTSYSFMKMCRDNLDQFNSIVNSLGDSLENTSKDISAFKSLFIHVHKQDFSSKQYYDNNQRAVTSRSSALTRFNYLVYGKYLSQFKRGNGSGLRKIRIHNYGEISAICEIMRESNISKFKCKICETIYKKSFNFKKHYYSQHSAKHMKCSDCGKSYGSEALLKQHKYDSHASIICSICGKKYTNRYSLLYHMRQHSGEQPYQCEYCDMKFKWSSRRAEHIRRYHLEPSVECDICHAMFRSLGTLYDHRKRHFNPKSRLHITQETPPVTGEEIVQDEVNE